MTDKNWNDSFIEEDVRNRRIETIAGIIILVILIAVAVLLLFKKEFNTEDKASQVAVEQEAIEAEKKDPAENSYLDKSAEKDSVDGAAPSDASNGTVTLRTKLKGEPVEYSQKYTAGNPLEYTGDEYQLPELYAYWDEYKLEAVDDIIRLERFRPISQSLGDSSDFYYYGDKNPKNQPSGRGLAVYAADTYYFGDWKEGKRQGDGMWLRIFPDEPGIVNGVKGVTVHSYSGNWYNDYPEGAGQEHFEYDKEKMEPTDELVLYNVIGDFARGLYNGKMLFMADTHGSSVDWYGTCRQGVFDYIGTNVSPQGKRIIMETEYLEEDYYLHPNENMNWGIAGLK